MSPVKIAQMFEENTLLKKTVQETRTCEHKYPWENICLFSQGYLWNIFFIIYINNIQYIYFFIIIIFFLLKKTVQETRILEKTSICCLRQHAPLGTSCLVLLAFFVILGKQLLQPHFTSAFCAMRQKLLFVCLLFGKR